MDRGEDGARQPSAGVPPCPAGRTERPVSLLGLHTLGSPEAFLNASCHLGLRRARAVPAVLVGLCAHQVAHWLHR